MERFSRSQGEKCAETLRTVARGQLMAMLGSSKGKMRLNLPKDSVKTIRNSERLREPPNKPFYVEKINGLKAVKLKKAEMIQEALDIQTQLWKEPRIWLNSELILQIFRFLHKHYAELLGFREIIQTLFDLIACDERMIADSLRHPAKKAETMVFIADLNKSKESSKFEFEEGTFYGNGILMEPQIGLKNTSTSNQNRNGQDTKELLRQTGSNGFQVNLVSSNYIEKHESKNDYRREASTRSKQPTVSFSIRNLTEGHKENFQSSLQKNRNPSGKYMIHLKEKFIQNVKLRTESEMLNDANGKKDKLIEHDNFVCRPSSRVPNSLQAVETSPQANKNQSIRVITNNNEVEEPNLMSTCNDRVLLRLPTDHFRLRSYKMLYHQMQVKFFKIKSEADRYCEIAKTLQAEKNARGKHLLLEEERPTNRLDAIAVINCLRREKFELLQKVLQLQFEKKDLIQHNAKLRNINIELLSRCEGLEVTSAREKKRMEDIYDKASMSVKEAHMLKYNNIRLNERLEEIKEQCAKLFESFNERISSIRELQSNFRKVCVRTSDFTPGFDKRKNVTSQGFKAQPTQSPGFTTFVFETSKIKIKRTPQSFRNSAAFSPSKKKSRIEQRLSEKKADQAEFQKRYSLFKREPPVDLAIKEEDNDADHRQDSLKSNLESPEIQLSATTWDRIKEELEAISHIVFTTKKTIMSII